MWVRIAGFVAIAIDGEAELRVLSGEVGWAFPPCSKGECPNYRFMLLDA
jgi:hypothetical protein